MARPVNPGRWLAAALIAASTPAAADQVACHLNYGGQTQVVEAKAVASPYTVAPTAIGSYFLFRVVYRDQPADLAGIKLYTYAAHDSGPALIHQASYPLPVSNAASHGFTGLHAVYEPLRDGELHYWCELQAGKEK